MLILVLLSGLRPRSVVSATAFASRQMRRIISVHPDSPEGYYGVHGYPFDLDAVERRDGSAAALAFIADAVPALGERTCDVLDLGCGHGRHAGPLSSAGHRVTGVDLSARCLQRARERFPALTLVQADVRRLPLPDAAFDIVLSLYSSLGLHGDHALPVLAEAARVTRPGGTLLLDVSSDRSKLPRCFVERVPGGIGAGARWRRRATIRQRTVVLGWSGIRLHALSRRHVAGEIGDVARRAGWTPNGAWGDWDGSPASAASPRLILRARRDPT